MYTNTDIALNTLYVLSALNLLFIIALYGMKIRNVRNRNIKERFLNKCKPYLIYIQANLESEEDLRAPPFRMNRIEEKVLQERLNELIEVFTDEQRDKLIQLGERLGFIDFHLKRLRSRSYRNKIDAAYHLGCLRVKEAVPALLDLLRRHPLDSSLFVIARAIAKCSRSEQDVKDMVQCLLSHHKSFPDLIVDMIEEAPIDRMSLFTEFIQEDHPELIQIGLNGLREYTNPMIASTVFRLTESSHEGIQRQAIQFYLKSSIFLPKDVIKKWIEHHNADIRLMTAQVLSELKNPTYIEEMQIGLKDSDQRVVYANSIGMLQLGEEGMLRFCELAREFRDQGDGIYLQEIIEDELKVLSDRLNHVENLTRYNALVYFYEKSFGRNKHVYRVV